MNKQAKQSAARAKSWLPGGAHRIAHEQRTQDKKTSPAVDQIVDRDIRGLHQAANVRADNAANSLVMYRAACLLLMAADPQHRKQAERLIAAADDLLGASQ